MPAQFTVEICIAA